MITKQDFCLKIFLIESVEGKLPVNYQSCRSGRRSCATSVNCSLQSAAWTSNYLSLHCRGLSWRRLLFTLINRQ